MLSKKRGDLLPAGGTLLEPERSGHSRVGRPMVSCGVVFLGETTQRGQGCPVNDGPDHQLFDRLGA